MKGDGYDPKTVNMVAWNVISQLGLSQKITKLQLGGPRVMEIIFPVEDLPLVKGKFKDAGYQWLGEATRVNRGTTVKASSHVGSGTSWHPPSTVWMGFNLRGFSPSFSKVWRSPRLREPYWWLRTSSSLGRSKGTSRVGTFHSTRQEGIGDLPLTVMSMWQRHRLVSRFLTIIL